MLGFSYATLRESKSLTMRENDFKKGLSSKHKLNYVQKYGSTCFFTDSCVVVNGNYRYRRSPLPLRTPRSINFRWIALSWPRPLLKLHLINFPHIWCRNIEWCMRSFIDSSCWEWKWSIHRRDVISKCLCGTPRSMLFRWIAICSSSENFTWFTSPSHICAGI
jgi:hypothetical protein